MTDGRRLRPPRGFHPALPANPFNEVTSIFFSSGPQTTSSPWVRSCSTDQGFPPSSSESAVVLTPQDARAMTPTKAVCKDVAVKSGLTASSTLTSICVYKSRLIRRAVIRVVGNGRTVSVDLEAMPSSETPSIILPEQMAYDLISLNRERMEEIRGDTMMTRGEHKSGTNGSQIRGRHGFGIDRLCEGFTSGFRWGFRNVGGFGRFVADFGFLLLFEQSCVIKLTR